MATSTLLSARQHTRRPTGGYPFHRQETWPSFTPFDWSGVQYNPDMDQRYYRPSSPGNRRLAVPERSSTGMVGGYEPRYYGSRGSTRDSYATPRTSDATLYPPSSTSSGRTGYESYSGRPRRQTFAENDPRREYGVAAPRSGRTAVIHSSDRPTSPLPRTYDREGYVTPATSRRETKKVYGVDDNKKVTRLPEEEARHHRRHNSVERGGHRSSDIRGSRAYHLNGPLVRTKDIDTDHGYSYTDPESMYRDTEPRWRQRRGSLDREATRERPISMIENGPSGISSREAGPPPSTRGFSKINNDMTRSETLREPRYRQQSLENSAEYPPYRESDPYAQPLGRSNSLRPTTVHQSKADPERLRDRDRERVERDRERERERDRERERERERERDRDRDRDRERERERERDRTRPQDTKPTETRYSTQEYDDRREARQAKRSYEDRNVESRGFGLITGPADRYSSSREESLERGPPPPPPTYAAEPVTQAQKPRVYPSEASRDAPRQYDRRERDRGVEAERERDRDSDKEDRDRERRRERERAYEKPREADKDYRRREGQREPPREAQRDSDSDRERPARHYDRRRDSDSDGDRDYERSRRTRDDDQHHPGALAATTAAPIAAYAAGEALTASSRDRHYEDDDQRRRPSKPEGAESHGRERQYVDDRSRQMVPPPPAEDIDPDEDYRRRVQQELERSRNQQRAADRESSDSDRDRRADHERRRRRDTDESRQLEAPRHHQRQGSNSVFDDKQTSAEPDEISDGERGSLSTALVPASAGAVAATSSRGENRVRIVEPVKEQKEAPKGILRRPTQKFPEDPNPIREGVAPLKDATKKGIPPGARWTKIDRRLVNPEALEMAQERFEERLDFVIVLRVLTKEEIQKFANKTKEIRNQRYENENGRHREDRDRDRDHDRHERDDDHDRGHHSDREVEQDHHHRDDRDHGRKPRRRYSDSTNDSHSDFERDRTRDKDRNRGSNRAIEDTTTSAGAPI